MNTYEYECEAGHIIEVRHPVGETWEGESCPDLDKGLCARPLRRVYTPTPMLGKRKGRHHR